MSTWYEKGVFYHMYPLGMTGAPRQNNLEDRSSRLTDLEAFIPYLKEMEINAIYIGPLFQSASHGYDTIDFRQTDCRLGNNEDLIRFVALCHQHQIKVVIDGVFNHTGRQFFAFLDIQANREQSAYLDWYRGVHVPGTSPLGDSFCYESWQGHAELPCLNLKNPQVVQYLMDVVTYWIDTFDIDGIRLDCANVLDFDFMKQLRQTTQKLKQDFWLMGEVIHGDYSMWVNDQMLHAVTNYQLHKSLYSGHNDHNYFEIAHNVKRLDPMGNRLYTFVDNHDEDRIASKLLEKQHLTPVYMLLYTLPGIPSVYYGGEWGQEGKRCKTEDYSLRPAVTIEQAKGLKSSLFELLQKLGKLHSDMDAFHGGRYQELYLTNRQYAFSRKGEHSEALIAVNNDQESAVISVPVPTSVKRATDLLWGTVYPVENGRVTITIKGSCGVILNITEGSDE